MPPCAPPISTVLPLVSLGSTAIVVTRPLTGEKKPPVVGAGPMGAQAGNADKLVSGETAAANEPSVPRVNFPSDTIMFCMCRKALMRAPAGM